MVNIFFYEIAVASTQVKRSAVFTYSSDLKLKLGKIVIVPLKNRKVFGIVLQEVNKPKYPTKQIVEVRNQELPIHQTKTLKWMLIYYPFDQGTVVKLFTPSTTSLPRQLPEPLTKCAIKENSYPELSNEQIDAVKKLNTTSGISLLHGETGSGKTRVYIELIKHSIKTNGSVLVLTPEISLSEQLAEELEKVVAPVVRYHSLQSESAKRNTWINLSETKQPHVIIGPRSALFLPIRNLKLIIIDEAHDSSYKHQQSPFYSTLQIAAYQTSLLKGSLIYGSATPNVADYFIATQKNYPIIKMTERPVAASSGNKRSINIINIRDRSIFTLNSFLSDDVIKTTRENLKKGMQSLYLINRRGTAQLIRCEICAWDYRCKKCDHALVYHHDIHSAVCHVCSNKYTMVHNCVECGGSIKLLSIGTKFIEDQLGQIFPNEQIVRVDGDSVESASLMPIMKSLASGDAKIIIGTQLVAKGLDLPFLASVIVVDAARQSNDFLGDERYYQLLHQVIGRGSRGHQTTKIFIQTTSPDDPIVKWSTDEKWLDFYQCEIAERKLYGYPPFRHIALLKFEKRKVQTVEKLTKNLINSIQKQGIKIDVLGPLRSYSTPSKLPSWQIVLKAHKRDDLIKAATLAPTDWIVDLEPIST